MTLRSQEADVERGFAAGADDYVVKPFSPRELVSRVEALIGPPVERGRTETSPGSVAPHGGGTAAPGEAVRDLAAATARQPAPVLDAALAELARAGADGRAVAALTSWAEATRSAWIDSLARLADALDDAVAAAPVPERQDAAPGR